MAKRLFDIVLSFAGLLILSPLLLALALLVKLTDRGPVFYRQQRVGRGGALFWIWKYRSMVVNAEKLGLSVTSGDDPRITPVGRFLRRWKLDELPQLWNVLRGDMSFVGPRPEVPRYVALYTEAQREILRLKPGITDLATLAFRDEEDLLRAVKKDREKFYIEYCVPRKIELNLEYARRANLWRDIVIIVRTLLPGGARPPGTAPPPASGGPLSADSP
jgi:lipopolysaccharide/colanic/teichoic acid biosynthesis glycosyltransferase